MKKIKVERAVYAAWDYELELAHLNEMSEKGWQLIQGGCFKTKYEWDDSVVYRYQVDYNTKIDNRMRYIETFREQGWEYINSTVNHWHYFRKVYDPEIPDEEYEIYSDRPSRVEMAGRLSRLMLVLSIAVLALAVSLIASLKADPSMARVGLVVEMLAAWILTAVGYVRMRNIESWERPRRKFPVVLFVAVAICGLLSFMVFASFEQEMDVRNDSDIAEMSFAMTLPDWVHIEVDCESTSEIYMQLCEKESEKIIADSTMENTSLKPYPMSFDRTVFLWPGEYVLTVQCDQENSIAVKID